MTAANDPETEVTKTASSDQLTILKALPNILCIPTVPSTPVIS